MLFRNIGLVDEKFTYRENMFVAVQNDIITYVGDREPSEEVMCRLRNYSDPDARHCCCEKYDDPVLGEYYDGRGKVLMPAFYNAHGHSPMCLMRGYGENLPLDRWLNERIFPFEAKLYSEAVYWSTLLTMAESMRFGIISTTDMYYYIDDMVRAVSTSGMKTNISCAVAGIGFETVQECPSFRDMREAILMYDGFENGRIRVDACAHAEYTNPEAFLRAVADTARELEVGVHVHVSETQRETEDCIERHGMTPVEYLEFCGLFDVPATAAHCVWLTDNDRDILAQRGVTVASCPASNMKLASGICDVPELYRRNITTAIGTDSAASNNSLNFFEEMKLFALSGKIRSMDPAAMTPQQVLRSATRAGALSQGRQDSGIVKEGFKADLIVVDADTPNMSPVHDILNGLVYSADGKDVCLTMADGRVLYRDGDYKTLDIEKTKAEAFRAMNKILTGLEKID